MRSRILAVLSVCAAWPAWADMTQDQAAARIAELAVDDDPVARGDGAGFELYAGLFRYRRTLEIDGCILRYTATPKSPENAPPKYQAQFDLTFTHLETDPQNAGAFFGYYDGSGVISLRTDPAHPGTSESRVLDATTPETYLDSSVNGPTETLQIDRLAYWMENLTDPTRIKALADALVAYRADYCLPTS